MCARVCTRVHVYTHTHTHTHTHTFKLQRVLGKHVKRNTRLKPAPGGPMELRRSRQPWDATALGDPVASGALG